MREEIFILLFVALFLLHITGQLEEMGFKTTGQNLQTKIPDEYISDEFRKQLKTSDTKPPSVFSCGA